VLELDTTLSDPTFAYEIVNIDGDVVYRLELKKSQLRF